MIKLFGWALLSPDEVYDYDELEMLYKHLRKARDDVKAALKEEKILRAKLEQRLLDDEPREDVLQTIDMSRWRTEIRDGLLQNYGWDQANRYGHLIRKETEGEGDGLGVLDK